MHATSAAVAITLILASANLGLAASPEPPPGATSCTGCHPASAKVETPVPPLAGRDLADMVAAMQAFRTGQRPSTVMDRIAKGFSEEEVRAIAVWFNAQR